MANTLPRPTRPSPNPPVGPLPSLPVAKSRKALVEGFGANVERKRLSSASSLTSPSTPVGRTVSSSALPTLSTFKSQAPSSPGSFAASNLPGAAHSSSESDKNVRKTLSIGSFPQPPKSSGTVTESSGLISDSATASETPPSNGGGRTIPPRRSSAKKKKNTSSPTYSSSLRMPNNVFSFLNGSGDAKSIHGGMTARAQDLMPDSSSPSQSRASSPDGSYSTNGTIFEESGEHDAKQRQGRGGLTQSKEDKAQGPGRDGKGNVIVSVRVRPDSGNAENGKTEGEWMVDGRRSLIAYRGREVGEYFYDNVFTAYDNNAKVYDAAAKRLVRRVMEGYHGTVFAYGMTGTGKTFSMQGTTTSPGVIPLAITDIFSYIRETPHREFLLRVSYLEIYNEKIHDLLSAPSTPGVNGLPMAQEEIKLREDSKRGVYATPLKEEIVQSPTQLLRVIARGDNVRRTSSTQYNSRSSRSHAVVQIVVESRERAPAGSNARGQGRAVAIAGGVRVSTLSLIDLAGSEKAAENKERRTEGAHINKSLLTLGTVIARLSGDKDKPGNGADKERHLPYRDSKLTRLLQPALSGNSLVSILCTIQTGSAASAAAANSHAAETLNTLKFAARAKNNIVSHAKKAEEALADGVGDAGSRALLDRYRMEILELRKQLENQPKAKAEDEEKARELEAEQRHEEQMLEMQLARTALKERIEHLNRLILSSKSIGVNANKSFASVGLQRQSALSNADWQSRSARSSASQATLEVPSSSAKRNSSGSAVSFSSAPASHKLTGGAADTCSDEDDSLGENGDGTASFQAQVWALQADLADRNRYISTLEKRLLQARRSSHSRVSASFTSSHKVTGATPVEGGIEALLREKDDEIADLRARLDDKDRMVTALRSAARKRDMADMAFDRSSPTADVGSRKVGEHRSNGSNASSTVKVTSISPVALLSPSSDKRTKPVDEMTKILDEMIQDRVESGHLTKSSRNGITLVSQSRQAESPVQKILD